LKVTFRGDTPSPLKELDWKVLKMIPFYSTFLKKEKDDFKNPKQFSNKKMRILKRYVASKRGT
jgi:hypothetical protein